MAADGVKSGTGRLIGVVFEAGAFGLGVSEAACSGIAGEGGAVFVEPDARTALNLRGEDGLLAAQCLHASGDSAGIELVDGEGAVTALRTPRAADKPRASAVCGVGKCGVHNLHEFLIAIGKRHAGKDIG
jgi:hypothetical protein